MSLFLQRIDTAPIGNNNLSFALNQWITVLIDTLNEIITAIQNAFNTLAASSYTSAEITAMAATLADGVVLYDSTLNVYVGKENGVLVKFTTAAYP